MTLENRRKLLKEDLNALFSGCFLFCIVAGLFSSFVILAKSKYLGHFISYPQEYAVPFFLRLFIILTANPFFLGVIFFYWKRSKLKRQVFSFKWEMFLRCYVVFSLIMLTVACFFVVTEKKDIENEIDPLEVYKVTQPVTQDDVARIINDMRKDPNYKFYFKALTDELVDQSAVEIGKIAAQYTKKEELQDYLEELLNEISPMVILFTHLEEPEKYYKSAVEFPELHEELWSLLYLEFKLTVLGLYYKANYDPEFVFLWNAESREFANHLKTAINELKD